MLRFAQRHYHPPENFIWGPPRRKRVPGTAGKPEVTDRSAGKARSPKEGRNQSNVERETEDTDRSEEWKMAKGWIDTEEYIETIPL